MPDLTTQLSAFLTNLYAGNINIGGSNDATFFREAAGIVGLRNGTNAQELRVYNTFTSSTNFEAIRLTFGSNQAQILADKGSGGGTGRLMQIGTIGNNNLSFLTNGSTQWTINGTGHLQGIAGTTPVLLTTSAVTGLVVSNPGELTRIVTKVTLSSTHAAYIAASATADVTIATIPAKVRVLACIADTTTAWAGTAGTLAFTVGKTAGGNEYLVSHDVKTAAVTKGLADADFGTAMIRATAIQGGDLPSWTTTTAFQCRLTSGTGNLGTGAATNLTQGTTVFYILSETYAP